MKRAYDINPSVGGPIMRDTLWFFARRACRQNQNYVAGLYENANAGDPTKWTYVARPRPIRRFFSITQNGVERPADLAGRQKHKFSLFYDNQSRDLGRQRAGVSPESFVAYRFPTLRLLQAGLDVAVTSKLLLEVRYANRGEAFGNQPDLTAPGASMIPVLEQSTSFQYRGTRRRRRRQRPSRLHRSEHQHGRGNALVCDGRARVQGRVQRHVVRQHELDDLERLKSATIASTTACRTSSRCTARRRQRVESQVTGEIGLFAQDRWTHQRLTLNLGVRFDQFMAGTRSRPRAGAVAAHPEPHVPGGDRHQRQGRHAAGRRRRTTCSATARPRSRSMSASIALGVSTIGNPAGIANTITRSWTDANRQLHAGLQPAEPSAQNLRASGGDFCGAGRTSTFGQPTSAAQFNNDTRFGWGNRRYNWEFSTSVSAPARPARRRLTSATSGAGSATSSARRTLLDTRRLRPVQHHGAARFAAAGWRRLRDRRPLQPQPGKFIGQVDNYTTCRATSANRSSTGTASTSASTRGCRTACCCRAVLASAGRCTDNCAVLASQPETVAGGGFRAATTPASVPYCHSKRT